MSAPAGTKPSGTRQNKPRKQAPRHHYRRTSAIIDERPDGKPLFFGYGRHLSKREKDRVLNRIAYGALAAVVAISLAVIITVLVYNTFVYPNQAVAWVNGHGISRHDRTVMTSYFTAAEAQAEQQGATAAQLGDPQSLAVAQLQKSLLTSVTAQSKLGIGASMSEGSKSLDQEVGKNQSTFNSMLQQYNISRDDYVRLVEIPRVLEQKIGVYLTRGNPTVSEQWDYARISVKTQAAAKQILQQLSTGANFAAIAKKQSQDSQTASTGGDLGWQRTIDGADTLFVSTFLPYLQKMATSHTKYEVVKYSATVWYVVELIGHDLKHPLSAAQKQQDQVNAFNTWIKPTQDTAIFNPPLPASSNIVSGGTSAAAPLPQSGSSSSSSSSSNGQL